MLPSIFLLLGHGTGGGTWDNAGTPKAARVLCRELEIIGDTIQPWGNREHGFRVGPQ
ncbi:MAG: hypothetical protein NZ707_05065 [Rhodospirillales bacterium]|nr:hypothetical protein [Rhodospirillales bacterium]